MGGTARAKSIRTILLVCGLFTLCFVPFHVSRSLYFTLRFLSSDNCQLLTVVSLAYKVWRPLVSLSSCLNPVLYVFMGTSFKNYIMKVAKKYGSWRRQRQNVEEIPFESEDATEPTSTFSI